MLKIIKLFALSCALAVSCFLPAPVEAQQFMNQTELLATIPGNSLTGISNEDGKTRWIQNYGKGRKKGKIAGLFGKEQYKSKWFVDGNLWCEDWGTGNGCWKVERVSAKQLRAYKDGKPMKNLWAIK